MLIVGVGFAAMALVGSGALVANKLGDEEFGHDGECRRCGFTKQAVDRFGFACEPG